MNECRRCGRRFPDEVRECPDDGALLNPDSSGRSLIGGRYEVLRTLGQGGMGVVLVVRHRGLQRDFALKLIQPSGKGDRAFEERFRREAEALGRLRHPHIVDVADYGVDSREGAYLAMELLEGRSLGDLLREGRPLTVDEALPLFRQIAEGLDAAHASGVVHRDLKPDNVFLARGPGGEERAKILDFGLVRWIGGPRESSGERGGETVGPAEGDRAALTRAGSTPGTLGYLAPEVLHGDEAGPAADLYALGVILYRMLTGQLPHGAPDLSALQKVLTRDPVPPSSLVDGLPPELDGPVSACLARDPTARPESAVAAARALESAWSAARLRRWSEREVPRRGLAAAALGVAAAAVLFLAGAGSSWTALDRAASDLLFAAVPPRLPSSAVELVLLDDEALRIDERPLADQPDRFAGTIEALFRAGARTVVFDVTHSFANWAEDPQWARLLYDRHEGLVLAVQTDGSGRVIGTQAVGGLIGAALGAAATTRLFGFAEMDPDPDGVVRRAPAWLEAPDGTRWPSLAARAAERHLGVSLVGLRTFPIDHRVDPRTFPAVSLAEVDRLLVEDPDRYDGALVIVGASFTGSGDTLHRIPGGFGRPAATDGPRLQALIVETLLAGRPIVRGSGVGVATATGVLAILLAVIVLLSERLAPWTERPILLSSVLGLPVAVGLVAAFSWGRFLSSGVQVPVFWPSVTLGIVAVFAAILALRRPRRPPLTGSEDNGTWLLP